MNNIIFQKQNGGLARPLPGEDHISALLILPGTLASYPSGMNADNWVKPLGSIEDLEALGFDPVEGDDNEVYCHYHVQEFFRMNPGATLWFGYKQYNASNNFSEVVELCRKANGKVRQIAVACPDLTFATAQIGQLQTIANTLEAQDMPAVILYTAKVTSIATLTTDLSTLNAPKVSFIIGQDGAGKGAELFTAQGRSISCIGNALGCLSLAAVHECIGWVSKFNVASGELDVPAFVDGSLYSETATGVIETLNTNRYIFLRKYNGIGGTYYNDSHNCSPIVNNDYAYIEANRTMDKAIRGVRAYLLPQLNGPVKVDATTGKLDSAFVSALETLGGRALEQMERDGELSGYKVVINPEQNVLATSQIIINIVNVPKGVMRQIIVKIGFATKIS
jgi:hypothetical protein